MLDIPQDRGFLYMVIGFLAAIVMYCADGTLVTDTNCFLDNANGDYETVRTYFALRPRNVGVLEAMVMERADPNSARYGDWMSRDEINRLVAPKASVRREVEHWIMSNFHYLTNSISSRSDHIIVVAPVFMTELVFGVGRDVLLHEGLVMAAPPELREMVDFIEIVPHNRTRDDGRRLVEVRREEANVGRSRRGGGETLGSVVDPGMITLEVIQRVYNIPASSRLASQSVSVGAMEYQGACGFSNKDLVGAQKANGLSGNPVDPHHDLGRHNDYEDTESALDIQMMGEVAGGSTLWYEDFNGWMYSWAINFFNRANVPDVISMSWGWNEKDQCGMLGHCLNITSQQYVTRANYEFMKIAARGVTITVSSGDAGSPGRTNEGCGGGNHINPVFPGSSKWVTSVGATYLVDGSASPGHWKTPICQNRIVDCANGTGEQVTSHSEVGWTSGSGFDHWETTPAWQYQEVLDYLNSGVELPEQQYWNRYGRAYPDVSALGHNCAVLQGDSWSPVDGTSCSSPIFAGVVTLLNNHQLSHGRPRLGFANPLFYQMARADASTFHDITVGNSSCTEAECCGPNYGFIASKGWDPVAGLGTPNVGQMLQYLDKLWIARQ